MSVLSDLKATMLPGTVAVLNVPDDASDYGASMFSTYLGPDAEGDVTLNGRFYYKVYDFASKAAYDPYRRRVYFRGGAHATGGMQNPNDVGIDEFVGQIYYDIATNRWRGIPRTTAQHNYGAAHNTHQYNHVALFPKTNQFIVSNNGSTELVAFGTNIDSPETSTDANWSSYPSALAPGVSQGFLECNWRRKSLLYARENDGTVYENIIGSGTWAPIFTNSALAMLGITAVYNVAKRVLMICGGSPSGELALSNRRCWIQRENGSVVEVASFPTDVYPYFNKSALLWYDPVTGDYVCFAAQHDIDGINNIPYRVYTLSPGPGAPFESTSWQRRTDIEANLPQFIGQGTGAGEPYSLFDVVSVSLIDEGVTMLLGPKVYLYKHADKTNGYDGYPGGIPTVEDEKDLYTYRGLTWNASQETANTTDPRAGDFANPAFVLSHCDFSVHDETEGDELWLMEQQYYRSGNTLFLNRATKYEKWFREENFKSLPGWPVSPCGGEEPDIYALDRSGHQADHFYGWGLISHYRRSLSQATLDVINNHYGPEILTLYNAATTPASCLPQYGCMTESVRGVARHLLFATAMKQFNPANSSYANLLSQIIDVIINSAGWFEAPTGGFYFYQASPLTDAAMSPVKVNTSTFTPTTTEFESITPALKGVSTWVGQTLTLMGNARTIETATWTGSKWHFKLLSALPSAPVSGDIGSITGQYAAGGRLQTSQHIGILCDAMFRALLVTGDTRLSDKLIQMATWANAYALHATHNYTASLYGNYANGDPYHGYAVYGDQGDTATPITLWPSSYTTSQVDIFVIGYKLTGNREYLEKAWTCLHRGTHGSESGTTFPATSDPNAVDHYLDTDWDGSINSRHLKWNKTELLYSYLIMENGGWPTVLGTVATGELQIVTSSPLQAGTTGTSYFRQLASLNGTTPYSYAVVSGALPGGLSLSSAGAISGTPTTAGIFTFTVRVTDASLNTADKAFSLTINPSQYSYLGYANGEAVGNYSPNYLVLAGPFPAIEDGTALAIEVRTVSAGTNVVMGIFSDTAGNPSTMLRATTSGPLPSTTGFKRLDLTSQLPLSNGVSYWIGIIAETLLSVSFTSSAGRGRLMGRNYTDGMPTSYSAGSTTNQDFDIRIVYAPGEGSALIQSAANATSQFTGMTSGPPPVTTSWRYTSLSLDDHGLNQWL